MKTRLFMFPGQGSQLVGMGKDFFEKSQEAREIFKLADDLLGFSLSQLCFSGPEDDLKLTSITQPALLTVSYIAYRLLGEKPQLAAGHSLGEYSALVAAGSLSFEQALKLVANRGKYMMEAVPPGQGTMAAIMGLDYGKIEETLRAVESGVVQVANWNSDEQIVIAGEKKAVEEAVEKLRAPRSVFLQVSGPFHTSLMAPAAEKLKADLDLVAIKDPEFPVISNFTGKIMTTAAEVKESLTRQIVNPVLWYPSMMKAGELGVDVAVELGPGRVLTGLLKRISRRWPQSPALHNIEDMASLEKFRQAASGW
ncbi:MAG TPA: ACP S-malonyltransferase [Candidatus Saccharicenans sp.]|nr:ACP S-malonyltransferase [Candidatus Saccharicenans sp.]HPB58900.1 ACP S-malonyltransferase [Candidatus Saccharicenans sp.]HQO75398.1 ACP S-malonyltransferase [Candidatus Saccharicenans sp.]HUM78829.1 ACP S-malonyltransferase [Candidatus Saccharicenans sp.]